MVPPLKAPELGPLAFSVSGVRGDAGLVDQNLHGASILP